MADPGSSEQPIERLQLFEVGFVVPAVPRRHLAVVLDHAARIDELIIAANERKQLATVRLERIQRSEGVSHVGDVARAILRDLRVVKTGPFQRDGAPLRWRWRPEQAVRPTRCEAAIVLVPLELNHAEGERRRAVENAEVSAAVKTKPDLVVLRVARPVPDQIYRFC